MKPARSERAALVGAARAAGPDAATLCGTWTVRELLAHLILREGHPAAVGIMVKPLAGLTESVQTKIAAREFDALLSSVADGPPWYSPMRPLDSVFNLAEFFIHTEDIRRAAPGWQPRTLQPEVDAAIGKSTAQMAKLSLRSAPLTITLETESGTIAKVGSGPEVTVFGSAGEVLLWMSGRDATLVSVAGDDADLAALAEVKRAL